MSSITEESPLADQLKSAVQAKTFELGWTTDADDTSLSEYLLLLVANGKSREDIADELSTELIPGAEGIPAFSSWLTDYVAKLTAGGGSSEVQQSSATDEGPIPAAYDNDLGESAPDNAPKGPKGGMRGGRGGRGSDRGRGNFDNALHRTRGSDRINSHTRGAPKGPKTMHQKDARQQNIQKGLSGLQGQQMPTSMMPGAQQGGQFNPISPQQQMEFMAMMEQQARMLAQFMPNMVPPGMNGSPQQNGQNGRSMFDRVERGRGGARGGRGRGANAQNGARKPSEPAEGDAASTADSAMEGTEQTSAAGQQASKDPSSTVCYFNVRCLNKDCQYAHQSPAAPPGTDIDMSQSCSFGAACKNNQCHAKHPSPALITAHKAEQECKFFPNCTNPNCPFKHPNMPLCQFGASCTNKECKFTHLKTKCKFNPCTNSRCPFMHDPGQNRNMASFSWSKDQADGQEQGEEGGDHVSTRKFVTEGEEEYIKPDGGEVEEDVQQEDQIAPEGGQQQQPEEIVAT